MKIENKVDNGHQTYGSIKCGDYFLYQNVLMRKSNHVTRCDDGSYEYVAMNATTGYSTVLPDEQVVLPVDCDVHITIRNKDQ